MTQEERDALLVWNVIAFLATEHIERGLAPETFAGATVDDPDSLLGFAEWMVKLADAGEKYARCVVRDGVAPSVLRIMDGGQSSPPEDT